MYTFDAGLNRKRGTAILAALLLSALSVTTPLYAQVAGGVTASAPCNQNTATGAMACMSGSAVGGSGSSGPSDSGGTGGAGGAGTQTNNVAVGQNSKAGAGGNGGYSNSGGTGGVGGAGGAGNMAIGINSSAGTGGDGGGGAAGGFGGTGGTGGSNNIAIGAGSSAGKGGSGGPGCCGFTGQPGASGTNDNIAFGSGAQANGGSSVALGANSDDGGQANVVSVGSTSVKRRLTNVAAGTSNTDAVNLGQLNTAIAGVSSGWNLSADNGATSQSIGSGATVNFAAGSNMTVTRTGSGITYGLVNNPIFTGMLTANGGLAVGSGQSIDMGGNSVHNMADGVTNSDGATVGQMNAANAATLTAANAHADAGDAATLAAANGYTDGKAAATLTTANAYTDAKSTQTLVTANSYTDTKSTQTLASANTYTDTKSTQTLASANSYADTKSSQTLASANSYTDSKVVQMQQADASFRNDVWSRFNTVDARIDRMGAMGGASAAAAMNTAGLPGNNRVGVGFSTQNGKTAMAVGYQRVIGRAFSVSLTGAFSGNQNNVSVGGGFSW